MGKSKLDDVEVEFGKKLAELMDTLSCLYTDVRDDLLSGDYRSAERNLDAADKLTNNIAKLIGRSYK